MQNYVCISFAGPTNEARAEGKLVFILPCKEEKAYFFKKSPQYLFIGIADMIIRTFKF